MVTNAETLRKIQVELGLTGSFKDRAIAEWLAKHNPSALEYERAVANFTGRYHHSVGSLFKMYYLVIIIYLSVMCWIQCCYIYSRNMRSPQR